jgi:hypothetical protein
MSSERKPLDIDLDEELNLTGAVKATAKKVPFTKAQREVGEATSEAAGFPSSEAKKTRRRRTKSPHTEQLGFKARSEVKEVFQELSDTLGIYDHTTFERAVVALLEKEGSTDLLSRISELVK